jgi:hypothetical protein
VLEPQRGVPGAGGGPCHLGEERRIHPLSVEGRAKEQGRRPVAAMVEGLERHAAGVDEGGPLQVLAGKDQARTSG